VWGVCSLYSKSVHKHKSQVAQLTTTQASSKQDKNSTVVRILRSEKLYEYVNLKVEVILSATTQN
jgi:hypothetical protein